MCAGAPHPCRFFLGGGGLPDVITCGYSDLRAKIYNKGRLRRRNRQRMVTKTYSNPAGVADEKTEGKYQGLSGGQLIEAYRLMYTSRKLDDLEILLKRKQRIFL